MLKIAFSPVYKYDLAPTHRFPMLKYELIQEQLLYEGVAEAENFFHPEPLTDEVILETHEAGYWNSLKDQTISPKEIRKIGFPMSPKLVERTSVISGGTVQCALYAQRYGVAMNGAGGTHHSFSNRGEGFCMLNDVAIGANYLLNRGLARKILVVDLDVHQGNGTASLFQGSDRVFTFSMHGEKNFPHHKEASHLDIGLPDGTGDAEYLRILRDVLPRLFDDVAPDFVFFNAGVDVLATDRLGRLSLSMAGCRDRDRIVMKLCKQNNIPLSVSMGGGYSERLATIVDAHVHTFKSAQEIFF